jgi:transporter family-2 protein
MVRPMAVADGPVAVPDRRLGRRTILSIPLALAFLAGAGLSLQAFVNGRLGTSFGSGELAALVNNVVGLVALVIVATASGALMRAVRRLRAVGAGRTWHYVGSSIGALFVIVAAVAAPKVGIALLTVALVCGQALGSVAADLAGLSPAGRRPLTTGRVLGVSLALTAVGIGAVGTDRDLHLGILMLAVAAGVGLALGQAALGQLTHSTGEPIAAATVGFAIGSVLTLVIVLLLTGGSAPNGFSAPPEQWAGGIVGATVVVGLGKLVISLGVLRLTLALVAGQSVGAVAIDLAAPTAGGDVTVRTLVSVLLTFAAVVISGMPPRAVRRRALAG